MSEKNVSDPARTALRRAQWALSLESGVLVAAAIVSRTNLSTSVCLVAGALFALAVAWSIGRAAEAVSAQVAQLERDHATNCADASAAACQKSEFFANLTHEIRTPMTAILGFTDVLRSPSLTESERQKHIGTVHRAGEHLLAIVNDILDLSKLEAGRMTVEALEVAPLEIARDVVELMRGRADERGLRLVVRCEGAIPSRVCSDPIRLRQVLLNLVSNAIKFTDRGEISIVFRLLGTPVDSAPLLQIEVRDTGIGIRQDQMDRLFKPFMQADGSTTRRYGGTGLGLAISARLVDMLGGAMDVESAVGEGSIFRFTLTTGTLAGIPLVSGLDLATRSQASVAIERLSGRVLLAEDGVDNQRLVMLQLRSIGLEVELAVNGQEAVDLALRSQSSRPFDLILMDLQMPELDGFGATAELRRRGWRGPILALTASAHSDVKGRAVSAGCDDVVSKPIERARLAAACHRWLPTNMQRAEAA